MPSPNYKSEIQNVTGNANVTICNKNLFNINDLSTDYFDINGNEFKAKDDVNPVKKYYWYNNIHYSGNITFKWKYKVYDTSQSSSVRGLIFRIYKTDGTCVDLGSYINANGEGQVTVDNVDYAYTTYGNAHNNTVYDFEIVVGSTATTYAEHQEQNFPFPLAEGQRLMKGDYLADDGIHYKRTQVKLVGADDEKWVTADSQNNDTTTWFQCYKPSNILIKNLINGELICSHFKNYNCYANSNINNGICIHSNAGFQIRIENSYLEDVSDNTKKLESFKKLLTQLNANGTPVTIEYPLNEEEIESYTEEQQEVRDEIKKTAHSYGEQTHIFCTDETSLIFNVEARKDMNTVISNLESMIISNASGEV